MRTTHRARHVVALATLLLLGVAALAGTGAAATTTTTVSVFAGAGVPGVDTGVFIPAGQQVTVSATGTWDVCGGACPSGPDGNPGGGQPGFVSPTSNGGALVGTVDGGATYFTVGSGPTIVSGPGELYLTANDYRPEACGWCYGDNAGSLSVTIAPVEPSTTSDCKNGGWRSYGSFKNQGDCVSYVATGGRNPASG